jgi:hypothetical protein
VPSAGHAESDRGEGKQRNPAGHAAIPEQNRSRGDRRRQWSRGYRSRCGRSHLPLLHHSVSVRRLGRSARPVGNRPAPKRCVGPAAAGSLARSWGRVPWQLGGAGFWAHPAVPVLESLHRASARQRKHGSEARHTCRSAIDSSASAPRRAARFSTPPPWNSMQAPWSCASALRLHPGHVVPRVSSPFEELLMAS